MVFSGVNIWRWNELQCHFHNVTEVHLVGGTIENQYGAVDMALGELLYCRYSTWWGWLPGSGLLGHPDEESRKWLSSKLGGGVGGLALTHKAVGLLVMRESIQVELGLWAADSAGVGSSSKGSPSFLRANKHYFMRLFVFMSVGGQGRRGEQTLFHFVRVVQNADIVLCVWAVVVEKHAHFGLELRGVTPLYSPRSAWGRSGWSYVIVAGWGLVQQNWKLLGSDFNRSK